MPPRIPSPSIVSCATTIDGAAPTTETVALARRWLGSADGRPSFCWVHLYEPHFPYAPPAPLAERFRDLGYDTYGLASNVNIGAEMVAIFTFQVLYGYIYLQIGVLVTVFLAGLQAQPAVLCAGSQVVWAGTVSLMIAEVEPRSPALV